MALNDSFFVAVGFVLFVLLLGYLGVHKKLTGALDERADKIRAELAEAQRLREEAAAVLASYEKKRAEAEAEAQAIVTQARAEAEQLSRETAERMADFVARRTRQAETKIAAAEAQAALDVRAAAADAAVKAAEIVLAADSKGATGEQLVAKGIQDLKTLMH
ncbi:MAG: ATP F0F1 synthase subunit B [Beijerinckiaceae bacterium]|nr:ATP F0F1 synthase subunit B [Beijerinckiaceae bacterium]MDO9441266.1 ATP F0F1 synthase subunit B [Beijerinckiaceae bacterium]